MSARRNSNRARCQHDGCEKFAQTRGLCKAHGGGSRCRDPSCNKLAQSRGLCIAHGGGRRCQHEGCSKLAQSKGFCISHGGGRRCTVPNCEKFSQVKGRCKSHSKLAEHSDQEGDDGDETETDRTIASPPNLRMRQTRQQQPHFQQLQQQQPHRSPPHQGEAVPAHHANLLPRLHQRRGLEALPLPRSFGLIGSSHQPLMPPRTSVHGGAGNRENIHHQAGFDRAPHEDPGHSARHQQQWEDSHKYEPRSLPGSRSHSDEDLPPLPYTYNLPATRPLFDGLEEKREANDPHQRFALLPSRFMQSRPPSMATSGALPTVSSIMAASASTVSSHSTATTHGHFVGHRHAEQAATHEPTSFPLLSFLDRNNETKTAQPVQAPWTTSSSSSTATTSSAIPSIGTTTAGVGHSASLPSIVLPPLKNNNKNPR